MRSQGSPLGLPIRMHPEVHKEVILGILHEISQDVPLGGLHKVPKEVSSDVPHEVPQKVTLGVLQKVPHEAYEVLQEVLIGSLPSITS